MRELVTPVSEEEIMQLRVGDAAKLSGIAVTGRDAAHKYLVENLIEGSKPLSPPDERLYEELRSVLQGGAIYHCGPIVRQEGGRWRFVSAGPTTSIREEIYQDKIIAAFGVRVVIGKGGMGPRTLAACKACKAIYLHGIGGAGVLSADAVAEVMDVLKLKEFGLPEAFWKIRLRSYMGIVTMDAHGRSLHDGLRVSSEERLKALMAGSQLTMTVN